MLDRQRMGAIFCTMKRFLPAVFLAGLTLLPLAAAGEPQSLVLLRRTDRATLGALLAEDVVVARVLDGGALVFADGRALALLARMALPYQILEEHAGAREQYLVVPRPGAKLDRLREPARLLHSAARDAVVSVPEGRVRLLLDLGFEVARIFRSPIRLAAAPTASLARESGARDPFIQGLVDQVSTDSIDAVVQRLQDFGSRLADRPEGREAAWWIASKLSSYGLAGTLSDWSPVYAPNVVAELRGVTRPRDIFVIGAHFDSFSHDANAPGADDNASGTAAVLECARILGRQRFASTLRFVAFSAEEYGLLGSAAYASTAAMGFENIVGMVNVDMIGYRAATDDLDLDVVYVGDPYNTPPNNHVMFDLTSQAASMYVPELPVVAGKLMRGRSDHESFWDKGYSAIFFHEDTGQSSPYIHTAEDVVGVSYNDPLLATLCIKTAVALLATLATPVPVPVMAEDLEAASGAGGVRLAWKLSAAARRDLDGVRVQRAETTLGPYAERTPALLAPAASMSFEDTDVQVGSEYWYRLLLVSGGGAPAIVGPISVRVSPGTPRTGLYAPEAPRDGGPIQIRYAIARATPGVHLDIYDVRGRRLRQLAQGAREPGEYSCLWDRRDAGGARAARGVYFVRLRADGARLTRKLVIAHE